MADHSKCVSNKIIVTENIQAYFPHLIVLLLLKTTLA